MSNIFQLPGTFVLTDNAPTVLENGSHMFNVKRDDGKIGVLFINGKISAAEVSKYQRGDCLKIAVDEMIESVGKNKTDSSDQIQQHELQSLMNQFVFISKRAIDTQFPTVSETDKIAPVQSMAVSLLIFWQKGGYNLKPMD